MVDHWPLTIVFMGAAVGALDLFFFVLLCASDFGGGGPTFKDMGDGDLEELREDVALERGVRAGEGEGEGDFCLLDGLFTLYIAEAMQVLHFGPVRWQCRCT